MEKNYNPKVLVLMSSYNGEQYIEEQIMSILSQINIELTLMIRDDGSQDNTASIVSRFTNCHKNIIYKVEKNIGAANSFLQLLYSQQNVEKYDYIAFSDQDDVWLPNKVISAIGKIKDEDGPALYYSALCTFDNETKSEKKICNSIEYTFEESLFKSNTPGCTMLMNSEGAKRLIETGKPKIVVMHDSYIYQFFQAHGYTVVYDQNSYIKYRIHGNNVSVKKAGIKGYYNHVKKILNRQKKLRRNSVLEFSSLNQKGLDENKTKILNIIGCYDKNVANLFQTIRIIMGLRFSVKVKTEIISAMILGYY